MDIPGIGKDFRWWHAITGVSAAALLACIARDWPNGATIAAGCCAIGIGTWINHPEYTEIRREFGAIIEVSGPRWQRSLVGDVIIVGGGIAALLGAARAIW